jgi:hypothetical protein
MNVINIEQKTNVIAIERKDDSINVVWAEVQELLREYGYDLDSMVESHGSSIDFMAQLHFGVPYYRITDGTQYSGKGFSMIRINFQKEIKIQGVQHYGLIVEVDSDVLAVQLKLRYM